MDRKHMQEIFRRAWAHRGASFVEIFQNCNVFNDGAFAGLTKRANRDHMLIDLQHGEPVRFGAEREYGVVIDHGRARVAEVAEVGAGAIVVHDETNPDPSVAFTLSRLASSVDEPTPVGVFRAVVRDEYSESTARQLVQAQEQEGPGDLATLLRSGGTWEVSGN